MKAGVGVRRPERKQDAYEQRMQVQLHMRTDMYFNIFHMDGCIELKQKAIFLQ